MPKTQCYYNVLHKICKTCRKNIYTTEMEAQEIARYQEHEDNTVQLRWYPCPHSKGWHLTSTDDPTPP